MPAGGRLTTRLYIQEGLTDSTPLLVLQVSDTGAGMDKATQGRIFEPFFTTKTPDQGTGLGLATIRNLIEELDGHIDVTSASGLGSCFTVHLPIETPLSYAPAHKTPRTAAVRYGDPPLRILIVEDDHSLRAATHRILAQAGHHAEEATNGQVVSSPI